ncbi:MAG: choice-of-anchor L domain-containing protein, partial [Bacteroidota bacterium]
MTQRIIYLLSFLLTFSQSFSQTPSNDECANAIQLGTAPFGTCTTTEYTNVDATLSTGLFSDPADNIPSCWPSVDNDVWFEFQTPVDGSFVDFEIFVNSTGANPIGQFKAALYRGECLVDELAELDCQVAGVGETQIKFDAAGLTPGISYFIRVDDQSATANPVWGTFNVCVDSLPNIDLMCDASSSTESSGLLYDSGGPDGDYQNNENCTFTICPTTPAGCISLTVNTYNTEVDPPGFQDGDQLFFYDGDNTFAPQIGDDIHGGGSCYSVQASSGCITIEWNSNGTITNPGFEIAWESSPAACPTFTNPNLTTSPTEALILEKIGALPNSVSNITIDCDDDAHAAFDGTDNSYLFMDEGVVLTTGSATYAFAINDGPGDPTTDNNGNADSDLAELSAQLSGFQPTMADACVLEMDVVAAADEISLEYIFGSDEYLGNINNFPEISDVVGIWISGPGIVGDPLFNNQQLISTI